MRNYEVRIELCGESMPSEDRLREILDPNLDIQEIEDLDPGMIIYLDMSLGGGGFLEEWGEGIADVLLREVEEIEITAWEQQVVYGESFQRTERKA